MRKIKLFTISQQLIYEGLHTSVKEAVEFAISKNISLHGIDLSYHELQHINLDGVFIHNAHFHETNLAGANMSEAKFHDCDFSGANLADACLCYSDLIRCNFRYTNLSSTDISMASLNFCDFQGKSLLHLDLPSAFQTNGLAYYSDKKIYRFSKPPTIVKDASGTAILFESGEICLSHPTYFRI